jgi:hypothetical protein
MIMSLFGGGGGDDGDELPCKFEMECSSHYHQLLLD